MPPEEGAVYDEQTAGTQRHGIAQTRCERARW